MKKMSERFKNAILIIVITLFFFTSYFYSTNFAHESSHKAINDLYGCASEIHINLLFENSYTAIVGDCRLTSSEMDNFKYLHTLVDKEYSNEFKFDVIVMLLYGIMVVLLIRK